LSARRRGGAIVSGATGTLHAPPEACSTGRWDSEYESGRWEFLKSTTEASRLYLAAAHCAAIKTGGSVLDIGCGEGVFQQVLSRFGHQRYLGIDISERATEKAKLSKDATAKFQVAPAEAFSSPARFDVIVFNETMYHFKDPVLVLLGYERFLKKDGIMIVSVYLARLRESLRMMTLLKRLSDSTRLIDEVAIRSPAGLIWNVRVPRPARHDEERSSNASVQGGYGAAGGAA
jgi:2-polyprenyl-3-methyl-5-hydroxy-6-metoxy-1,4-benzoquinol methylase